MKSVWKYIICAIATGAVCGMAFAGIKYAKYKKEIDAVVKKYEKLQEQYSSAASESKVSTQENGNGVSKIASDAMPALVAINVSGVTYKYDMFGRTYAYETTSNASGIIAAQNNGEILIATNYHVVEDAVSVSVNFIDESTAEAEVKASDESEDLAVVSVKVSDLSIETLAAIKVATFGDSESLCPGEMVIAIGNALGYGQSVTVGYVSAVNREVTVDEYTMSLIQTDVAINPGNSGGALLNSRGEFIGINNAKIADESVEGICYAIPCSTAIPIIESLMNMTEIPESEQAYIGIVGQVITKDYATAYNMPRGIYIKEIKSDSPAEKAGLTEGMIITKINGITINSQEGYEKIISCTRGNTEGTVTVKIRTEGTYVEKTFDITFGTKN